MTTIPSPAEFLTAAYPDEHDEPMTLDELVSDLDRRVTALEGHGGVRQLRDEAIETEEAWEHAVEHGQVAAQALADLEAKHGVVLELVEEIRGIVKKSTSKVSLEVKAAIDAWANPLGTETPSPAPDASPSEPAVDDAAAGDPQDVQQRASAGEGSPPWTPAHDADVEEWRKYARDLGWTDVDQYNRSQIRTLLGIEQPVGA